MNNRILVLISFLFFTISLNAQRTISGVVISGDNQERLPFSDIISRVRIKELQLMWMVFFH
jgi:hypothetical protein